MSKGAKSVKGVYASKPIHGFKTFFRLLKYVKTCPFQFFISFTSIIIYSISVIYASYLLRPIIEVFENAQNLKIDEQTAKLLYFIVYMAIVYVVSLFSNVLLNRLMVNVACSVLDSLRKDTYRSLEYQPSSFFDSHKNGDVMSRFINDVDAVSELFSGAISQLLISIVSLLAITFAMINLNLYLSAIMLFFAIVVVVLMRFLTNRSNKYFKKQQSTVGELNGFVEEIIRGDEVVKLFNQSEKLCLKFDKINEEYRESSKKATFFSGVTGPIMNNLSHLFYCIIASIGAVVLILTNSLSISAILVTFLSYVNQFSSRINQIAEELKFILSALAGAERIFEIIDSPVEDDKGKISVIKGKFENDKFVPSSDGNYFWHFEDGAFKPFLGNVCFNDVTFSYDGKKTVLNNVSFNVKSGEKIAFVGSTGAGKTTIINLLSAFYKPQKGQILIDDVDISDVKKSCLRSVVTFVLQDTHLFSGTIAFNVAYGNSDATISEIKDSAVRSNCDYFISRLPNGYETLISGDGSSLSQGQRQLISIARATICNSPILVLDEATSSIDSATEKLIVDGIDNLMKNKTVFVIAHRLSTVKNADKIIVLEHGEILEVGSHEQLISKGGKYFELYHGLHNLS